MSLLHYVTYKYIVIKDKKLGLAYYILAAIILLYTIVQIFINKAFMQFDLSPNGNIRLLVNTPHYATFDFSSLPSYCCDANDNTNCAKCKNLDGLSLNWPVESRAINIATFIKKRFEKLHGHKYKMERENDYFSLHPEDALVKIEHSVMSTSAKISASHRMMHGELYDVNGDVIKILNSSEKSRADKIYLKELLMAANISLNQVSDAMNAKGRTFRENGVVLQVFINYRNSEDSFVGSGITYSYRVRHIPYSDYRVKQEIPMPDNTGHINQRVVFKRYTARIEFIQTGKIGTFSMSNLLIQLASLMGLLTLTATIIDTIALYLIPSKEKYRQYVFDTSPEIVHKPFAKDQADTEVNDKKKAE